MPAPSRPDWRRSCRRSRSATTHGPAAPSTRCRAAARRRRSTGPACCRIPADAASWTCGPYGLGRRCGRTHPGSGFRHPGRARHHLAAAARRCHRPVHRDTRRGRRAGRDGRDRRRGPGVARCRGGRRPCPGEGRPDGAGRRGHHRGGPRHRPDRRRGVLPGAGAHRGRPGTDGPGDARRRTGCCPSGAGGERRGRHRPGGAGAPREPVRGSPRGRSGRPARWGRLGW